MEPPSQSRKRKRSHESPLLTQPFSSEKAMDFGPTLMTSSVHAVEKDHWARLVPGDMTTDSQGKSQVWNSKEISININSLHIGRHEACLELYTCGKENQDSMVVCDPCVSKYHCHIYKDEDDNVWIEDKSSNGTFLNNVRIGKNCKKILTDQSEIILVTKNDPKKRSKISFLFYLVKEEQENSTIKGKYHFKSELGKGAFAEVWLGIDRNTGDKYAIKQIDIERYDSLVASTGVDTLEREITVMKSLSHKHIIALEEHIEEHGCKYLVLEYAQYGDLSKYIYNAYKKGTELVPAGTPLKEEICCNIFLQILSSLEYIHKKEIVHRDLKPDNILLSSINPLTVKLTDFGLANYAKQCTSQVGSEVYAAPEVFTDENYGIEVDYWSLGCILYAFHCGSPPFFHDPNGNRAPIRVQQEKGVRFPKKWWGKRSPLVRDLICRLLKLDKTQRWTAKKCKTHKWVLKVGSKKSSSRRRKRQDSDDLLSGSDSIEMELQRCSTKVASATSISMEEISLDSAFSDVEIRRPKKIRRRC